MNLDVPARGAVADTLLIGVVTLLSVALYAGGLGFYSDDWSILSLFRFADDQSLQGILAVALDWLRYRPGQALNLGVLYWLFGLEPLGYHASNAVVLLAGGVLFYLVLRECGQPRPVALAVALLFLLLPHYSSARFWFAAFAVAVSMATYFLSLYADLRVLRPGAVSWRAWKLLALVALVASCLTYEVFLPLFLLNPLLVWYCSRHVPGHARLTREQALFAFAPTIVAVVALALFKAAVATRQETGTLAHHLSWFGGLLGSAASTAALGEFGLRLPWFLAGIVRDYAGPLVLACSAATGAIVFVWLAWTMRDGGEPLRAGPMLALVVVGALVFVAGYAIFVTNFNAAISATGANNRISMAAAAGVALIAVGLCGGVSCTMPAGAWRTGFFSVCIALGAASGFLVVNTLARFWIEAAARQQQVLAAIREHHPVLEPGTVLLVEGVCPYVGPAPVFETSWDLGGALRIAYADPSLAGDIITPKLAVTEEGIYTSIYGARVGPHSYERLLVFDVGRRSSRRLAGPLAAASHFREWVETRAGDCRSWREGYGESLFVPGAAPIALAR